MAGPSAAPGVLPGAAAPLGAPTGGNGASSENPATVVKSDRDKIGRNDPCWCGSGKKYKKCHGA
jgi:preprotein translocase subunit SecA